MGHANFPNPHYSITHLFEPSTESFSSGPIRNGLMLAQGVFLPEKVHECFAEDELLRIYLDKTYEVHHEILEHCEA